MLNTKKIEKVRKFKGITQISLSNKLGINVATYQNLLKSGEFRVSHLLKLSEMLGISIPNMFIGYDMNEETSTKVEEATEEYRNEIKELKKEIKYLKEIVDLLKAKNK